MKPSRPLRKRKRKDRTWAEAATLAIQLSTTKVIGIRPILQTIYDRKLKEISLNKAAENVLTTMLNHHAQLPNCPFFRVKGRYGLYALKESWLKKNSGIVPDLSDATDPDGFDDEDDLSSVSGNGNYSRNLVEVDRVPIGSMDMLARENHTFSIHGRAMPPEPLPRKSTKMISEVSSSKNNMDAMQSEDINPVAQAAKISLSSPISNPVQPVTSRPRMQERVYVWNSRNVLQESSEKETSNKYHTNLDLETPNSFLVNANMRNLINRETFSMLPPSYQFKLTTLLPECDRIVDPLVESEKQVLKPSSTALTNEFFSQSLQEWRDRLGDGEFTRETRSRIAQEIAKERSKIDPWKEKFFEEFYGQKQVPVKRLRSRGSECSHLMHDFGIEAQLAKFADLRKELQENPSNENTLTSTHLKPDILRDKPQIKSPQNSISSIRRRTLAAANAKTRNSYRMARNKFVSQKRRKLSPTKGAFFPNNQHFKHLNTQPPSSIVMKPSGALSALARCANLSTGLTLNSNNNCDEGKENGAKYLDIRKETERGSAAIFDHSYTSTPWHKSIDNRLSTEASTTAARNSAKSSTLVLYPQGNLVNSTMAIMQSGTRTVKEDKNVVKVKHDAAMPSFPNKDASFKIIKPSVPARSNGSLSDTERVLSICARPLTPESFVTGNVKSSNSFLTQIKQVPSPLIAESFTATSTTVVKTTTSVSTSQQVISQTTGHSNQVPTAVKAYTSSQTVHLSQPPIHHHVQAFSANTTVASLGMTFPSQQNQPISIERNINKPGGVSTSIKVENKLFAQSSPGNTSTTTKVTAVRSTVNTVPWQSAPLSTSPLAPGRLSIAGIKRSQTTTQDAPSPPGSSAKWGATSSPSPPLKKTRTLAEIKAHIKAKKAANAAASTRPSSVGLPQPGAVAANSHSHMFCATTFPVYFPLVTSSPSSMVMPPSTTQSLPTTASYIRLPTTATLPLERLQWVSQHSGGSATTNSEASEVANLAPLQSCVLSSSAKSTTDIPTTSGEHKQPTSSNNKQGTGKIILKIKAAGSAISLKVDADVIKKELKRKNSVPTSDEDQDIGSNVDSSSNDSISEDSEEDDLQIRSHKSTGYSSSHRKLNVRKSSDSESDCKHSQLRWSSSQSSDGVLFTQNKACDNVSTSTEDPASTLLLKQQRNAAVFGVSPYNVSIKPPSTTCDASSSTTFPTGNSLFQKKTSSLSFRPVPTCGSWSANMSVSTAIASNSMLAAPTSAPNTSKSTKFKSTSKGKSMKHMQELARSSMIHSDESADDGDSSEDDEDEPGDVSTTTASENDKYTESDDSSQSWLPGRPDSAESSLSDDNSLSKRQTHFPLKKEVKTRGSKSSTQKVLSMTIHK